MERYKCKFFLSYIKLKKEIITFGDVEIQKGKFHHSKNPVLLQDGDIDNRMISIEVPFCKNDFNYFICIGNKDDDKKVNQLCMMLPKPIFQKFWWN